MIRRAFPIALTSLLTLIGTAACGSSPQVSGSGGGNTGTGGNTGAGGNTGTGGTASCVATPGMCGAPFTATAAGQPDAGCTDNRELAFIPDGTVLKKICSPYHVMGNASANGHLTIEAGVHVRLADDAKFEVGDANSLPGSVDANGTPCDPVVFEPDSASGRFDHVKIGSAFPGEGKGNSHLHYVELHGGASNPATLDRSVLFLTGKAPVLLDHVDVLDSKHFGLALAQGQPLDPTSNHVFIDKTPDGAVFIGNSDSLDGFPTILVGCDPGPGIQIETPLVARSMTWATQPVPLLFRGSNLVVDAQTIPTVLTIAAPNTLLFGATVGVTVGGNVGVPANLVADGDITFDAIDPVNGWHGFFIAGSANQETLLRGGHVGHAGTVQPLGTGDGKEAYASIILDKPNAANTASFPRIEHETIHDATPAPPGPNNESAGIYIWPNVPGTEPDYTDATHANTFSGCDVSVARSY